ncbi:MAG: DUF2357 domain-containing protein [Fibrobacteria bacterium]|nr:DUF2357 domain-containing protein [Fibrobacteria bacterium]
MDSSTSVGQWCKANELGVLSKDANWKLSTDKKLEIELLEVLHPGQGRDNESRLEVESPKADPTGWMWSSKPLFFDNGKVQVEIALPKGARNPRVFHLSKSVCDRFVAKESRSGDDGPRLVGLLDFGNDLGDFELAWEWEQGGVRRRAALRTTVYSTKLDLHSDFRNMFEDVAKQFKSAFSLDLLRQTQWNLLSSGSPTTLQSWLAVFRSLETDLHFAYRRLVEHHRQRLRPETEWSRVEKIRRVDPRREEEIARGVMEHPGRVFRVERQVLDPDRIENRFAKHVLSEIVRDLERVRTALAGREQVSEVFRDWIEERWTDWNSLRSHPFWRGIGKFHGFRQESLALQRDPMYSRIMQGWHLLRKGLSLVISDRFRGGIQSVDDLYEVWCLVQLDKILIDLGWTCETTSWKREHAGWDDLARKAGSLAAQLHYVRADRDGESIELLYQPSASATPSSDRGWEGIQSLPVPQRPDIVLRHALGDKIRTWIFDAKYRVELLPQKNGDTPGDRRTEAPADAINQMHRYRDALLWTEDAKGAPDRRLRESIGAFALFPGKLEGWDRHAQSKSVEQVNIGAFPLHPGDGDGGFSILRKFIGHKTSEEFAASERDSSTPIAKGSMPVPDEAFVFFGLTKKKQDGLFSVRRPAYLYHVPVEQVRRVELAGHDRRNWTHVAPRKSGGDRLEIHGVYKIRRPPQVLGREEVRKRYAENGIEWEGFGPETTGRWTRYVLFELDPPTNEIELGPIRGPQGSFGVVFWSSVPTES